jgi:hypothetical protein
VGRSASLFSAAAWLVFFIACGWAQARIWHRKRVGWPLVGARLGCLAIVVSTKLMVGAWLWAAFDGLLLYVYVRQAPAAVENGTRPRRVF